MEKGILQVYLVVRRGPKTKSDFEQERQVPLKSI